MLQGVLKGDVDPETSLISATTLYSNVSFKISKTVDPLWEKKTNKPAICYVSEANSDVLMCVYSRPSLVLQPVKASVKPGCVSEAGPQRSSSEFY